MKILLVSMLLGGAVALAQPASNNKAPADVSDSKIRTVFPEIELRGYGRVSGKTATLSGGASLLTIRCESPSKAELLQAKYLSDMALLPKVKTTQVPFGGSGGGGGGEVAACASCGWARLPFGSQQRERGLHFGSQQF